MTSNTNDPRPPFKAPVHETMEGISTTALQLGWLLREAGVGFTVARTEGGGAALTIAQYDPEAPLSEVTDELVSSLQQGWESADGCPAIDDEEAAS